MSEVAETKIGCDVAGRPYARPGEVKSGTWLEADGDFTCIKKGAVLQVKVYANRKFVDCDSVSHGLVAEGPRGKNFTWVSIWPIQTM